MHFDLNQKKFKNCPSLKDGKTGTFQMKCCKLNFKTYVLSKHKIAIQTKFNRALDRIFSEIQIDILLAATLCKLRT